MFEKLIFKKIITHGSKALPKLTLRSSPDYIFSKSVQHNTTQDRLGGPSNAQTEELSRTNMDISTDLHELHHVIRCVGVELGRLADKQEGPVWECSGGGHTLQHLNSELEVSSALS